MNRTKIEWVKNPDGTQGYTWNPITGCLFNDNGLCKGGGFPCYAYRLAHGRLKNLYLTNKNIAGGSHEHSDVLYIPVKLRDFELTDPFYPRFQPKRLKELNYWGKGRRHLETDRGIFVCDMSDLFGIGIPDSWIDHVFYAIRMNPFHRFYLLTKQPQNLAKWSPFPDNCWVGVTATNEKMFREAFYYLQQIRAKVKYISFEPLLGSIKDQPLDMEVIPVSGDFWNMVFKNVVNWIIIGSQTKPYKPPKIEWVREIVEAADKAGFPVFLKENLRQVLPPEVPTFFYLADSYNEVDQKPTLRQEMPSD